MLNSVHFRSFIDQNEKTPSAPVPPRPGGALFPAARGLHPESRKETAENPGEGTAETRRRNRATQFGIQHRKASPLESLQVQHRRGGHPTSQERAQGQRNDGVPARSLETRQRQLPEPGRARGRREDFKLQESRTYATPCSPEEQEQQRKHQGE